MEKADIIDHAEASDALVKQLTEELQGTVPHAKYEEVLVLAEERAVALNESKEAHERQVQTMRSQLEESLVSSVSQAKGKNEVASLKNQHAVDRENLMMEISRLTQALGTEQEQRQAAEKEALRLGSTIQERQGVSEAAKNYIATLEEEKAGLESELAEAMRPAHTTRDVPTSRLRATTGNSRLADLEAGVDPDVEEEDRKSDVGLSSPVAKALRFVWAKLNAYPAITRLIGERPPRLSPAGQSVLVYMLVLHMLIVLRIV